MHINLCGKYKKNAVECNYSRGYRWESEGRWRCSINHICILYSLACGSNSNTCLHFMAAHSSLATRILRPHQCAGGYVKRWFIVFFIVFYKESGQSHKLQHECISTDCQAVEKNNISDWNRLKFKFNRFWDIVSGVRRFQWWRANPKPILYSSVGSGKCQVCSRQCSSGMTTAE